MHFKKMTFLFACVASYNITDKILILKKQKQKIVVDIDGNASHTQIILNV